MNVINDNLLKKIATNAGIILSGNAASAGLGFISFLLMARAVGPNYLGYFALAQAYVLIINSLINVQTWESLIKFGAKGKDHLPEKSIIKTNCIIDLSSAVVACIAGVALLPITAKMLGWNEELVNITYLYCLTIPFTLTTLTIGIPRLFDKFFAIAKIQFGIAIIKLASIALLFLLEMDSSSFILTYIVCEILLNICLIILSLTLLRDEQTKGWLNAKFQLANDEFKFLWWTNLRTIVRIPVRQLDVMIINQIMSIEAVGIYKAYKEIVSIVDRLGEPVNQALYPEYAKLIGRNRETDSLAVTKKIILLLSALATVVLAFLLLSAELIISRGLGQEYMTLINAFYLLVLLYSINLALTPINSLFVAAGFAKTGFYLVLSNNILYLLVAIVGGMLWGIYGVILAFGCQLTYNQGMKLFLMKKYSEGWASTIR